MSNSYLAEVDASIARSKEAMVVVRRLAIQSWIKEAQTPVSRGGNMPVDTNFLRASLVVTTGALPAATFKPKGDGPFPWNTGPAMLAINGAELGEDVLAVWTANYSRFVHYGTKGHQPRPFRDLACLNWQRHVDDAVATVKARLG